MPDRVRIVRDAAGGAVTLRDAGAESLVECTQWVPQPIEQVFAFFSDARNLERITPPMLRFRVLHMTTATIASGTEISYRLRLHGLPIAWTSRIIDWEPPRGFTDMQTRGPYRYWHHRHAFESHAGGTHLRDRVRYRLPLHAFLPKWVRAAVEGDLARIFLYRQSAVAALFNCRVTEVAPSGADVVPPNP